MPPKLDKMKIFLTGSNGFIGRNVKESKFFKQYDILSPSHSELDLLDEKAVRDFFLDNTIDVVIHSACKPGHRNAKDFNKTFYENMRMFFNLARNSNKFKKMINIGSGAIYDMRQYRPKMAENYFDKNVPVDEHGFCKYICGKYIEKSSNIIDLRVFGIFGKYEDYYIRFISNAICKTLFDLPITIKQNRKFDYIFIDDFIKILECFVSNEVSHPSYNITPDKSIELLELANIILKISGKDLQIKIAKEGMGMEYSGDNLRLKEEIKDLNFTPIDETILKLYKWYEANKSIVTKECLLTDK